MPPRETSTSHRQRAFLLVEATLTAAVLAVGLVFIGRALGSSLKALSRLQTSARLLHLAQAKLGELELQAQQMGPLASKDGAFDSPNDAYGWSVAAVPSDDEFDGLPKGSICLITLAVAKADQSREKIRLQTRWPSSWIASGC